MATLFINPLCGRGKVAVPDKYIVPSEEATRLKGPLPYVQVCLALEMLLTAVVFAISFYFSAIQSITETTVSFKDLGSGYSCSVLIPRNDEQEYSTLTSELAQFSEARYHYTDCINTLSTTGFDVCANGNRVDYVISALGTSSADSNCIDILLNNHYRLCESDVVETTLISSEVESSFPRQNTPSVTSNSFHFSNASGINIAVDAPFETADTVTDFVPDRNSGKVYVVSSKETDSEGELYLFEFSITATPTVKELTEIEDPDIVGLAVGDQAVYLWSRNDGTSTLYTYSLRTGIFSSVDISECANYATVGTTETARMLSYGEDNQLYAMCSLSSTPLKDFNADELYYYLKIDPATLIVSVSSLNVTAVNTTVSSSSGTTTTPFTLVEQLLQVGSDVYLIVNQASLSKSLVQQSTLENFGAVDGEYMSHGFGRTIYLNDGANSYFNTTSNTMEQYTDLFADYYTSNYIQIAYTYGVCNGVVSNITIDANLDTSFSTQCNQAENGVYYQNNEYITIPASCAGLVSNVSDIATILTLCPAVKNVSDTFTSTNCRNSYSTVCDSIYTNNPPYSCTKTVYTPLITILATAIANAGAGLTVVSYALRSLLRFRYKYGVPVPDRDASFKYSKQFQRSQLKRPYETDSNSIL